jgi:drug/metabolite transporter (DMT)-like permease
MAHSPWLWVVFTLIGAGAQTARNAMQRNLVETLGTVGATHVRFLFGFPFALLFLAGVLAATGRPPPRPTPEFWPWIVGGASAQIVGTALMLMAMTQRSFVVATAYLKTEPVQVALFGLVALGDRLTLPLSAAILIATAGVMLMSWRPGAAPAAGGRRPMLLGVGAGGCFALAAIGYRGAILALDTPHFVAAATFSMTVGLLFQTIVLSAYLRLRQPRALIALIRSWRASLPAGFFGALGSEFWFLAFAIATAASVRTLALIEVVFAQGVTVFVFRQRTTARDIAGVVLVVIGAALLVWKH